MKDHVGPIVAAGAVGVGIWQYWAISQEEFLKPLREAQPSRPHSIYRVILKGEGDEAEVGSIEILKCVPGHHEIKGQA
jgi:hypothetical protein